MKKRIDAQIEYLKLGQKNLTLLSRISDLKETIILKECANKAHQKLNGQLQEKLSKYEDKAAHYRRKAISRSELY